MHQIMYVMQFKGQVTASSEADNVLTATTLASSCTIQTVASSDGVTAAIQACDGGEAYFESTVTFTGETTLLESGVISFGDGGNKFYFSTVGQGHIDVSAVPNLKHGAVIWKLDRGEGKFEGATGLITSNFTVSGEGEVVDNQFGIIFLK